MKKKNLSKRILAMVLTCGLILGDASPVSAVYADNGAAVTQSGSESLPSDQASGNGQQDSVVIKTDHSQAKSGQNAVNGKPSDSAKNIEKSSEINGGESASGEEDQSNAAKSSGDAQNISRSKNEVTEGAGEAEQNQTASGQTADPAADAKKAPAKAPESATLQGQIDAVANDTAATITLDKDYAECLLIPDGKDITLDLNGHTVTPAAREEGADVDDILKGIIVRGKLTLTDSSNDKTGKLSGEGIQNARGVEIDKDGTFVLDGGTITGFQIDEGSGAGILAEKNSAFIMKSGTVSNNGTQDTAGYGGGIFINNVKSVDFIGGEVKGNSAAYGGGIGFYNLPADYTMGAVTVDGNKASVNGGGIYFQHSANGTADLTFNGTSVTNNEATGNGGGLAWATAPTVTITTMTANGNVSGNVGGAIYMPQGTNLTINGGTFNQNKAYYRGGAITVWTDDNTRTRSTIVCNDGTFNGNELTKRTNDQYGGAIYAASYTDVTINGGEYASNSGARSGGAICTGGTSMSLKMTGGKIHDNTLYSTSEAYGGGISTGKFEMTGGEIYNNGPERVWTQLYGGGVNATQPVISGGRIYKNRGTHGGGIRGWLSVTVKDNAIIEDNYSSSEGGGIWINGDAPDGRNTVKLDMEGGIIRNNTSNNGGGAYVWGRDSSKEGNYRADSEINFTGGEITGNKATNCGGGMLCAQLTMSGGTISNNTAARDGGGAYIGNDGCGGLKFTGGSIVNNTAGSYGGGMRICAVSSYMDHEFSGGSVSNNRASYGGGIAMSYRDWWNNTRNQAYLEMSGESEISENTATADGGGIYLYRYSKFTQKGGTITKNTANANGGGISVSSTGNTADIKGGSLFANTSGGRGNDMYVWNTLTRYFRKDGDKYVITYETFRPTFSLCKASQMSVKGAWYDELEKKSVDQDTSIDNAEENQKFSEEDDKQDASGYIWHTDGQVTDKRRSARAYTFKEIAEVAQVGDTIYPSVQDAVNAVHINPENGTEIKLLKENSECVDIPEGVTCTLDLNGQTLRGAKGTVITVEKGADLTIKDSSEAKSGKITGGNGTVLNTSNSYQYGGGLLIYGTTTLKSGNIEGCYVNYAGGGVYVGNNGAFTIDGGKISNNYSNNCGAGIYAENNASVIINGGDISENTVQGNGNYYGGGVFACNKANVTMNGGFIRNNNGSGVYVDPYATFTLNDGEISGNVRRQDWRGGGGICTYTSATININGGVIKNNKADGVGGGITLSSSSKLNLNGGEIIDNTAGTNGGGIYTESNSVVVNMTGGNITENSAQEGGGIYFQGTADASKLTITSGKVYDNYVTNGTARDIFATGNANADIDIMPVSAMNLTVYNCWFNAADTKNIKEEIKNEKTAAQYYLTASFAEDKSEDGVCRIGDKKYGSLMSAIADAKDNDTIYLLKDWKESVAVSGKTLTIDLNGYMLQSTSERGIYITNGGSVRLANSSDQTDHNSKAGNNGVFTKAVTLTSGSGVPSGTSTRGVYVTGSAKKTINKTENESENGTEDTPKTEEVTVPSTFILDGATMRGFGSSTVKGGGIYAAEKAVVEIKSGIIENCTANYGGAIYATTGSTVKIEGGTLRKNTAAKQGGAVSVVRSGGADDMPVTFRMSGGEIESNSVAEKANNNEVGRGGGIYFTIRGSSDKDGKLTKAGQDVFEINGGTIRNNTSQYGGGLFFWGRRTTSKDDQSTFQITNASFEKNEATSQGGGAYIWWETSNKNIRISDTTFKNNKSNDCGGFYVRTNPGETIDKVPHALRQLTILNNVTVTGNEATTYTGGLGIYGISKITGCHITDNHVTGMNGRYGALYLCNASDASGSHADFSETTTIENTEISNNSVVNTENVRMCKGRFELNDVTFSDNTCKEGFSGIYCWGNQYEDTADGNLNYTSLKISNCNIKNNKAGGTASAALSLGGYTDTVIDGGTVISGNEGHNGTVYAAGRTLTINEATIENNTVNAGYWNHPDFGGGAIFIQNGTVRLNDGTNLLNNSCSDRGGAIALNGWLGIKLYMQGGLISGNKARSGGAIYATSRDSSTGVYHHTPPSIVITGGIIENNTASLSGGAICSDGWFIGNSELMHERYDQSVGTSVGDTEFVVKDNVVIRDNHAGTYGGGVYTNWCGDLFRLEQGGKIYDNSAALGQDIYAGYSTDYITDKSKYRAQNELRLITAEDMMSGMEGMKGIGWLDEIRGNVITDPIKGKMVRAYALTLNYRTDTVVAVIGNDEYTSLQDAIDAVKAGKYTGETGTPEICLVTDDTESVQIPSGTKAILNLNGYLLHGINTAISAYGDLEIKDEKKKIQITGKGTEEQEGDSGETTGVVTYEPGTGSGTITGSGVSAGGGVRVYAGGHVILTSGTISNCLAGEKDGDNTLSGGAGVCADSGIFEMRGGIIKDCQSRYGAAVLVRTPSGTFQMTGGTIEENTASRSGVIFNKGGTVRITGGKIRNNMVTGYNGTIYNESGRLFIEGRKDSPVEITGNTAQSNGGAVHLQSGTASFGNVKITGNHAVKGSGGAVYVERGKLTIGEGSVLSHNRADAATSRGGAIYQHYGSIAMVGGSITANSAARGGGVAGHPTSESYFTLAAGKVYGNTSRETQTGNDFYSAYEGNGTYNPSGQNHSHFTVIAASGMKASKYNVWRDDTYTGETRIAEKITEGQYVTGDLTQIRNAEITAAYVKNDNEPVLNHDFQVKSLELNATDAKGNPVSAEHDGTAAFDTKDVQGNAVDLQEQTAKELVEDGKAQYTISETDQYLSNAKKEQYVLYNGKKYEQEQAVEWSPGNDSSDQNGIVRSYDTILYNLQWNIGLNDATKTYSEEQTVRQWFEVTIPASLDDAEISDSGLNLDVSSVIEKTDDQGQVYQVLSGYKTEKLKEAMVEKGSVSVKVNGMKNGSLLKPTFRSWIEGNEDNTKNPASAAGNTVTVSASALYNLTLKRNSSLAVTDYFNLRTGEKSSKEEYEAAQKKDLNQTEIVYGTMLGFGITAEMYNANNGRGLKGLEVPDSQLSFNLSMKGSLYKDGEPYKAGTTSLAPYLWAYKENENTTYGRALGGTLNDRLMDFNDEDDITKTSQYAYDGAPWNAGGGDSGCYSGGSWSIAGNQTGKGAAENTFTVTVSNYAIGSGSGPNRNSDGSVSNVFNNGYVKPFSAGYVQMIFPVPTDLNADGYYEVHLDSVVSDLSIKSASGQSPMESSEKSGIDVLNKYYNDMAVANQHAVRERNYADNYYQTETGLYVDNRDGNDNLLSKNNYFLAENRTDLGSMAGTGTTPLMSRVWTGTKLSYQSQRIRTDQEGSRYYIAPDVFNPQTDYKEEYNYLTAFNILQKFDADAFEPLTGNDKVINVNVNDGASTHTFGNKKNIQVWTDESATTWDANGANGRVTRSYNLTVLYAAKKDGSNWNKKKLEGKTDQDDGGVADMDKTRETDLEYYETYDDLKKAGKKCVAILYEIRNCCIRNGRNVSVDCKMQVTDDFNRTGNTYCTTDETRGWTMYRPDYKNRYRLQTLKNYQQTFTWDTYAKDKNGAQEMPEVAENKWPEGYEESVQDLTYQDGVDGPARMTINTGSHSGYLKSQYEDGNKVAGTHNGWIKGASLLFYTMDSQISIEVADVVKGSNGTRKVDYNVSEGERTANFEVQPSLAVNSIAKDNELVANGSQSAEITIQLLLPKGLSYTDGSITFDYKDCGYKEGDLEWSIGKPVVNEDGTSTVELKTYTPDIKNKFPKINFACFIGNLSDADKDVNSGENLVVTSTIHSNYEESNHLAVNTHSDSTTIRIIKNQKDGIYMSAGMPTEVGEDIDLTMNYSHLTEGAINPPQLMNILPYNGDNRDGGSGTKYDTVFSGNYRVKTVTLKFSNENAYNTFKTSGKLLYGTGYKYVTDGTARQNQMNKISGSETGHGTSLQELSGVTVINDETNLTVTYSIPEGSLVQKKETNSGIALYCELPGMSDLNSTANVTVTLSARKDSGETNPGELYKDNSNKTQEGGNQYADDFFFRTDKGKPVGSSVAVAHVISRTASGYVFMDQERDGKFVAGTDKFRSGDYLVPDVTVELHKVESGTGADGKTTRTIATDIAKDVLGNEAKTTTDGNGRYILKNLAAGTYAVVFKDGRNGQAYVTNGNSGMTLSFGQLSATTSTIDSENGNTASGRVARSCVKGIYPQSPAGSKTSAQMQEADGIYTMTLPTKDNIGTSQYATTNWNAGFYYRNATIQKKWDHMRFPVLQGTSVDLTLRGRSDNTAKETGSDTGTEETKTDPGIIAKFNLKQKDKTTGNSGVTGERTAGSGGMALGENIVLNNKAVTSKAEVSENETDMHCYTWEFSNVPLQAEDQNGRIDYTVSEDKVPEDCKATYSSSDETNDQSIESIGSADVTLTVTNTQVDGEFAFTKTDEQHKALRGAEFTLYYLNCTVTDNSHAHGSVLLEPDKATCWTKAGTCTSSDLKDLNVKFGNLPAGTYRLIETKAPGGYQKPHGQWQIVMAVKKDENGEIVKTGDGVPVIELAHGDDSTSGIKAVKTFFEPPAFEVYTAEIDGKDEKKLRVKNVKPFLLPETGTNGLLPFLLIGFVFAASGCVIIYAGRKERTSKVRAGKGRPARKERNV